MAKEKKTAKPETKGACFVIMEIGAEGSAERLRSDEVFGDIIEPAVKEAGYAPVNRADHIAEPGKITAQIIEKLITVPMVVVDLTGLNPNVIYELGVRHSTGKPVVQIMEQVDKLPFDLYDVRTIPFARNIRKAKQAIEAITKYILSLDGKAYEHPFAPVLQMISLRESGKPESAILADIMKEIQIMRSDVAQLAGTDRELWRGLRHGSLPKVGQKAAAGDVQSLVHRLSSVMAKLQGESPEVPLTVTPPPEFPEPPPKPGPPNDVPAA